MESEGTTIHEDTGQKRKERHKDKIDEVFKRNKKLV